MNDAIVTPLGFSHVRLTVTDIRRSKAFYEQLFGMPPGSDFSDEIGERLVIETSTVKSHLTRVMTKLDTRDRLQTVVWAWRSGLLR